MSLTGLIILTIAFAVDCFVVAWHSGAIHQKVHERLSDKLLVFFTTGRTFAMLIGLVSGNFLQIFVPDHSYIFGISLIALMGVKLAIDSLGFVPEEKVILIDSNKTMALLTLAGSFNTFFAGLGFGLAGSEFAVPLIVTAVSVFIFTLAGKISGKRKSLRPEIRIATLIAGLVILALSIRLIFIHIY